MKKDTVLAYFYHSVDKVICMYIIVYQYMWLSKLSSWECIVKLKILYSFAMPYNNVHNHGIDRSAFYTLLHASITTHADESVPMDTTQPYCRTTVDVIRKLYAQKFIKNLNKKE